MRYGLIFLILGGVAASYSAMVQSWVSRLALTWTAVSLLTVAGAYLLRKPHLLLKRPNGTRPIVAWFIFAPNYLLSLLTLWIYVWTTREPAAAEIVPNLWLGRWMSARKLLSIRDHWAGILDLTAEFPRTAPHSIEYLTIPVLDGTAPSEEQLRRGIEWIDAHTSGGPVLVHCALGHGRSATLVVAYLMRHDASLSLEKAINRVKRERPGVLLNADQVRRIAGMFLDTPDDRPGASSS